eukprot:1088043-Pelagomonas_calceolata.AAC.1
MPHQSTKAPAEKKLQSTLPLPIRKPWLVMRAVAHLALYYTVMDEHPSPKLILSSRRMAVAVHCQS